IPADPFIKTLKAKLANTENKASTPKMNKLRTKEEKSKTGLEK
ncbi:6261_t:CDS:1, partial [Scutellospora calospora]